MDGKFAGRLRTCAPVLGTIQDRRPAMPGMVRVPL